MVYLTRKEYFNAAHKLYNENWSDEKNREVFGKCANTNWHGHNYVLEVTVKGTPDPDTGYVMDAKVLSEVVNRLVVDKMDHSNLNLDVDFLKGILPSTENLVLKIWEQLLKEIPKTKLHCIRLHETRKIYAEYYGESH